jgi:S-adenosylmethionine synthetase
MILYFAENFARGGQSESVIRPVNPAAWLDGKTKLYVNPTGGL